MDGGDDLGQGKQPLINTQECSMSKGGVTRGKNEGKIEQLPEG